jgi:hypothetical protein
MFRSLKNSEKKTHICDEIYSMNILINFQVEDGEWQMKNSRDVHDKIVHVL